MARRPTKDVWIAAVRLERAAAHLTCHGHNYGGSVEGDILAVVQALHKYYEASRRTEVPQAVAAVGQPVENPT